MQIKINKIKFVTFFVFLIFILLLADFFDIVHWYLVIITGNAPCNWCFTKYCICFVISQRFLIKVA